ncbi:MAG TPA: YHS domain-containing protein [Blastocatellia bacterium]|nr:YHS domain-containing protein [Blastocatellia bacterium]
MAAHTDPVCGMQVNEQQAAGKSQFQGETYYFCSQSCKNKFDQNPQLYIGGSSKQGQGGQSSGQSRGGGSSR